MSAERKPVDIDELFRGLHDVPREQFFAVVRQLDVNPCPRGRYPYYSDWELRNRALVGRSSEDRYALTTAYASQGAASHG